MEEKQPWWKNKFFNNGIFWFIVGAIFAVIVTECSPLPDTYRDPCPETVSIDTVSDQTKDSVAIAIVYDTLYQDTIIYRPRYVSRTPSPNQDDVIYVNTYADTVAFDSAYVSYRIVSTGTVDELELGVRKRYPDRYKTVYRTRTIDRVVTKRLEPPNLSLLVGATFARTGYLDVGAQFNHNQLTVGYGLDKSLKVSYNRVIPLGRF